jgi:group I intron endonuclease
MLKTLSSFSFGNFMPKGYGKFGAVYRIRNRVNGKPYIGSSVCLRSRFNSWSSTFRRKARTHMTYSVQKYGVENFFMELVEIVNNSHNLNEREQYFVNKYIKPLPFHFHYNTRLDDISRNINVELPALRKKFRVGGPDGEIHDGHGIGKFCDEHVGNDGSPMLASDFAAMLNGKIKHCKGWHLPETKPEDIYKHFGRRKSFVLEDPEGALVEFSGIQEFEEKYDVHGVSNLLNPASKIICLKGWVVPGTDRSKLARRHYEEFTLKEISTGKLYTYRNISDFCKDFGIQVGSNHISTILTGERLAAHGFCLPETDPESLRKVKDAPFFIKDPTGKIHLECSYSECAQKNDLNHKSVSALFIEDSGKGSHKGWEPSTEAEYIAQLHGAPLVPFKKRKTRYWLGKKRDIETVHKKIETHLRKKGIEGYLLSDTSGEIFITKYLVEFCDDMGMKIANARRARYQSKEILDGWKRFDRGENQKFIKVLQIGEEIPDPTLRLNRDLLGEVTETQRIAQKQIKEGYYGWIVKTKNSETHLFNLNKFCNDRDLHAVLMKKNSSKGKEYKGYFVKKNLKIPKDFESDIGSRYEAQKLYV